jgi:hypothetical protein
MMNPVFKKYVVPIVIAVAVVSFLIYLSTLSNVVRIPSDEEHRAVKLEKDCWPCHSPTGVYPRKAAHPKKSQCFLCHKFKN